MGINKIASASGSVRTTNLKIGWGEVKNIDSLLMQPNPVNQLNARSHFVQFSDAPKKQRKKHNGCCYSYHNHTPFPFKLTIQISHFLPHREGLIRIDQHGSNIWHGFDNFEVPLVRFGNEMPVFDVILQL